MLKRNWPVTAAVAVGLVLAVGSLVAVLSQRDTRLAASNTLVDISGVALPIAPGGERCSREDVPEGADRVRIFTGTFKRRGQPVEVVVRRGRRTVSRGRVPGGYGDDAILLVPLRPRTPAAGVARVCVRNLGRHRLQFAGNRTPGGGISITRIEGREEIRLDWLLPGRPSWAGIGSRVATRFAATKPTFVGAWTLWALCGVLAALWAGSIVLLYREASR